MNATTETTTNELSGHDAEIRALTMELDTAQMNGSLTHAQKLKLNSQMGLLHLDGLENPKLKNERPMNFIHIDAYVEATSLGCMGLNTNEAEGAAAEETYNKFMEALHCSAVYKEMLRSKIEMA